MEVLTLVDWDGFSLRKGEPSRLAYFHQHIFLRLTCKGFSSKRFGRNGQMKELLEPLDSVFCQQD